MVKTLSTLTLVLFAATGFAAEDRERRAKVALALAKQPSTEVAAAPEPRPRLHPGYVEAHGQAVAANKVLVLYVGCEGRHPVDQIEGAVVACQRELAPYPAGTIIVAYPRGTDLVEHCKLGCPDYLKVPAAVAAAAKKKPAATAADPVIQKPLDWQLKAGDKCGYCGADCRCGPGLCPSKCTVAAAPAVVTAAVAAPVQAQPLVLYRGANGNLFYAPSNCPNGRCPNQAR